MRCSHLFAIAALAGCLNCESAARPPVTAARVLLDPAPHPAVLAVPAAAERSIASLARYIAAREPDELLRARAAHDWIATRIAYDVPALSSPVVPDEDYEPDIVFSTRRAVCGGYAGLFERLARALGLEAVAIVGHAWDNDGLVGAHAWNAVRADGRWYLLDVTWDAGGVQGTRFVPRYSTHHLFVEPERFALRHAPIEEGWYLLASPPKVPSNVVVSRRGLLF